MTTDLCFKPVQVLVWTDDINNMCDDNSVL